MVSTDGLLGDEDSNKGLKLMVDGILYYIMVGRPKERKERGKMPTGWMVYDTERHDVIEMLRGGDVEPNARAAVARIIGRWKEGM